MVDTFLEKGYAPYFRKNTRMDPNGSGSCIDNAFIKVKINIESIRYVYNITHHFPLFLSFNIDNVLEKGKIKF